MFKVCVEMYANIFFEIFVINLGHSVEIQYIWNLFPADRWQKRLIKSA